MSFSDGSTLVVHGRHTYGGRVCARRNGVNALYIAVVSIAIGVGIALNNSTTVNRRK